MAAQDADGLTMIMLVRWSPGRSVLGTKHCSTAQCRIGGLWWRFRVGF